MTGAADWIPTVQLAITTAGAVGVAWVTVQQIKAKTRMAETTRRIEAAARKHEQVADEMQTQIGEFTRLTEATKEKP